MRKAYAYMTVLAMSVVLATGCQKAETPESTETETAEQTTESAAGTDADTAEKLADYHLLQGVITEADSEKGVFTLKTDDGETYTVTLEEIGDIETEIAANTVIAIGYIGNEVHDSENLKEVQMIAAVPGDDDWAISYAEGTTTANAMSTFTMKTEDGTELGFMKDGCPMDEDALGKDSGEKISVVYMDSEDVNFPLEIRKME